MADPFSVRQDGHNEKRHGSLFQGGQQMSYRLKIRLAAEADVA
jgi:hypothetical protein